MRCVFNVLINSSVPAECSGGYIQTVLFCLFEFVQHTNKIICIAKNQRVKIAWLPNSAVKKGNNRQTTTGIFLSLDRV